MKRNDMILIYALIVVLLLYGLIAYYYNNQDEVGRRTNLVGDGVCGNFLNQKDKDACCSEAHKNEPIGGCAGSWIYVEEDEKCRFVCDNSERAICESVGGGIWREFSNGCVDSCILERNKGHIACAQALTYGCDCGENECWNGSGCEGN